MQNFDEIAANEDREFQIRGETFTLRRVRPEILTQIREIEQRLEKDEEGKPVEATHELIAQVVEDRLLLFMDDSNGAIERWKALRAREEDPITYADIMAISRWAYEVMTGFPTMPPASSASGATRTAASSKAGSR